MGYSLSKYYQILELIRNVESFCKSCILLRIEIMDYDEVRLVILIQFYKNRLIVFRFRNWIQNYKNRTLLFLIFQKLKIKLYLKMARFFYTHDSTKKSIRRLRLFNYYRKF